MVPYLRAISTASITASEVLGASAAKMPPVWNQRTPSSPNNFSQFTSPGFICEAAEWPRSEQPSAARMPKPFSVKLSPTRVLRPRPSNSRQITCDMSTPPCMIRSSTSQPRSLTGNAVTAVERLPQHLRMARATLYSPPPSQTWKLRALRTRPKPGSKRSITSPKEAQSQRVSDAGRIFNTLSVITGSLSLLANGLDEFHGVAHARFDAAVILLGEQLLGDEVAANAAGNNSRTIPFAQRLLGGFDAAGGHDARPRHRPHHVLHELRTADRAAWKYLDDLA